MSDEFKAIIKRDNEAFRKNKAAQRRIKNAKPKFEFSDNDSRIIHA